MILLVPLAASIIWWKFRVADDRAEYRGGDSNEHLEFIPATIFVLFGWAGVAVGALLQRQTDRKSEVDRLQDHRPEA